MEPTQTQKRFSLKLIFIIVALALLAGLFTFFLKRTERADTTSVIEKMRSLNRLETASFTIEKVIQEGENKNEFSDFLFGDKILLVAHGEVIAGFDLSELQNKDIEISGKAITLHLPKPQILTTSLDNSKTKVFDRKLGILTKGDQNLEAKARSAAQEEITKAACEGKILQSASDNAHKQLTVLLQSLGFETINIIIPNGSCN